MGQKTSKYPPKTLVNLQKVELFSATYVDGLQNADTRLVMKIGPNFWFLHPAGVDSKLKRAASWLTDAIKERTGSVEKPPELPQEEVDLDGVVG